jgi:4-hydroxy-tetrahydrodipicolinate synthase
MAKKIMIENLSGVWSATPTPFTDKMEIDVKSIERMIEHHVKLGVKGLFLAGTCGEGAWMTDNQRQELVKNAVKYSKGRLTLAVQVTDNSSARILDNIKQAQDSGADIAVIAPPYFLEPQTPKHILDLYQTAIRKSPLPIGIYDRGKHGAVFVSDQVLKELYLEKNVVLAKDSSGDLKRMSVGLAAKKKKPSLRLLSGWEFNTVPYIQKGYDGVLVGGGIFNGFMAGQIIQAVKEGKIDQANKMQEQMNQIMYQVFGGKSIKCWLSGQKKLLVDMGIFSTWKSYLNYPLTPSCEKAIKKVIKSHQALLMPWKGN